MKSYSKRITAGIRFWWWSDCLPSNRLRIGCITHMCQQHVYTEFVRLCGNSMYMWWRLWTHTEQHKTLHTFIVEHLEIVLSSGQLILKPQNIIQSNERVFKDQILILLRPEIFLSARRKFYFCEYNSLPFKIFLCLEYQSLYPCLLLYEVLKVFFHVCL